MFRKTLALAILLAFVTPLAAQVTEKKDPKEEAEKLRKEAVAFLRETMGDVANMRTLENRISFSAEMAGLMWYHDEREARVMFNAAAADFRELLSRLEHQMNELPDDADGPGSLGGFFMGGMTEHTRLMMKYRVAMGVRQQMATAMADHDPDLALGFYYDTATANPKLQNTYGGRDSSFESQLVQQMAEKNPTKAVQFGIKSLDKGLNYQHIELLKKLHAKHPEAAAELGSAILSKAKEGKFPSADYHYLGNLLSFGKESLESSRKPGGKPAIYTSTQLREIADAFGQMILKDENAGSLGLYEADAIAEFSPNMAAQVRAKLRPRNIRDPNKFTVRGSSNSNVSAPPPDYVGPVSNSMASNSSNSDHDSPSALTSPEDRLEDDLKSLGKGQLPKEERDRAVAQARKILLQTKGRDKQIVGLSMLASQVAKAGDKELATEIMRDAEKLVNPNPKNYQDFLFTWMLASGYAESNPDKAFPILEDAIGRANNVISAFVQVGEFIDVTEEMISDGEAQVGAFGGGMIRGLSRELGIAESTIDVLVQADFAKTKALTNRFERPEVRVLAKMLVLRSVLGKKEAPAPTAVNIDALK